MKSSNGPEDDDSAETCPHCGQPRPKPTDLVENLIPPPGLYRPEHHAVEEKKEINRRIIALALYVYLAFWSIGMLILAAIGKTPEAVALAEKLALPALPLLGIVIGSYFERRS